MAELECLDNPPSFSTMRLSEEGVTSLERELDTYFKLVVACNNRVQMMHALAFNNKQCQYLVDKLEVVIASSSLFLTTSRGAHCASYAPLELENHLLSFKLLLVLATEIERFIKGCSQDAWVPIAMTLTNVSEFVSSIGFHLELCQIALSKRCGVSGALTLDQVADISKDVDEIVKAKAFLDKEDLLKKISLALPLLNGDKKDLASYLLQRLLRVTPIPGIPLPESKWGFSRYLALLESIFKKVEKGVSIGRGSSATVFKAMWLEMEVAVKVFHGEKNLDFRKEVDILAGLCHLNIMSMFCFIQERQKCSIFMELMDGDLLTLMQQRLEVHHDSPPFNMWEAIDIMHQIAEGGKYLHEHGIVHRDLKSMNILVKSVKAPGLDLKYIQAKVADFNVSKIKKNSTTNSEQTMNVGSNRWMAPELIQLQSIDDEMSVGTSNQSVSKHPHKCDIYSFAMVCYEILTGELPFGDVDNPRKMKAMKLEGARPKLPAQCPFQLRALIERCWSMEPKSRPTFDDICRELKYVKYVLMTDTSSTFKTRGVVMKMMGKYADALEDLNKADELQPNDAWTLRNRGEVKRMMGKYADALEDLNKANEIEPNNPFTLQSRGAIKRMVGKCREALEDLNKADELEPNEALTLQTRGEVKRVMGMYVDALEDLNKADKLESNHAFTLCRRGDVKKMMGKYAEALEDLNKADGLQPNDAWTLRNCGEVKRMMGMYVEALEDLSKANELQPNDAWTLKNRGEVKRMMGKYANALEDLDKADELEPNDAWTLKWRGDVKRMMGNYANALEDLNMADKFECKNPFTLGSRGEVKRMMGKYPDALKDFNKANELQPNDVVILKRRGEVKRTMGKYIDALEDFNKANELQPNDVVILKRRGEVKQKMGMYVDALEDLNKAHELEPNDALTLQTRGEVKRMMGKYVGALEDLNKAHEIQPNDAFTLQTRGEVKRMLGQYANALEDFNKANEVQPNNAWTLKRRGEVKRMMGQYTNALEDLNKADELEPNNLITLRVRGAIKRMMGKYVDALVDLSKADELERNDVVTSKRHGDV